MVDDRWLIGGDDVKVSVIVPVYNAEGYIGRCIESLRSQLLDGLEFIFVDDCSTDGSMAAVEAWATGDGRVRILRNGENLGPGPSRNRGIEAARGDYLSFVDSDDYVSPGFYELLYAAATAGGGHDVAKGRLIRVNARDGATIPSHSDLNVRIRKGGRPLFALFTHEHQSALYRRSLFDAETRNGATWESRDTTFLLSVCLMTEDIVLDDSAIYSHVIREGPAMIGCEHNRYISELEALVEKAVLLEGIDSSPDAKSYLDDALNAQFANYFSGIRKDPSLAGMLDVFAHKLCEVVGAHALLRHSVIENPSYRALSECRALLPPVEHLSVDLALDGAFAWMDFLEQSCDADRVFFDECVSGVAIALQMIAYEEGLDRFRKEYVQAIRRIGVLPANQQIGIFLGVHRRLASTRNLRGALGQIARAARAAASRKPLALRSAIRKA